MAQSDLIAELCQRAEEAAESIRSDARAEADRLAADADRRIEKRRQAVLRSKEQEYRAEARADIAAARHEAMRAVLLAKTRLVERVLERAKALLPDAARSAAYLAALPGEIESALQFVDGDGAVIRCREELVPMVREALGPRPSLSVEASADAGSGFTAMGQHGSVRIDATLETRLERLADTLAIEIHERVKER